MTAAGAMGRGFPWIDVEILSIDAVGVAKTVDRLGRPRLVQSGYRRAKGALPKAGERWIISRDLGYWTFACVIDDIPPVISGDCQGVAPLFALLNALDGMGLITNEAVLGGP